MASLFTTYHLLRRAAPKVSKEFFTCQAARHTALRPRNVQQIVEDLPLQRTFRSGKPFTQTAVSGVGISSDAASPLSPLNGTIRNVRRETSRKSYFPETSDKAVAYWLLGSAASVFGLVVFGGLTRLTESGLSITEWRPVTGSLPPMNATDWDLEFTKYRSSPEFKQLNPRMTLEEFKSIYYMEWGHRQWGRAVGLTFLLPAVYFIARRKVSAPMAVKTIGIAGLIGFQGVLGWWMVKSGLKDDLFAPGSHPRVSQYRLTAHLGTAFICYTAMLWNGLSILRERQLLADPVAAEKNFSILRDPKLKIFRRSVAGLAVLVFCTAMSGGLVAGLDAGLIYNEFPQMGLRLTPPRSELFSDFYSHTADGSDIWWRNMLENPSLVQLDHRILATTTFTSVLGLWAYTKLSPTLNTILPAACKRGMHGVVSFVWLQVILGISTLIYLVPLPLASAHQAGSLALLSSVMILGGRTWVPSRASRLVAQKFAKPSSALERAVPDIRSGLLSRHPKVSIGGNGSSMGTANPGV
ncbi:Cytochrome c oxidase assembly protein cox15 [Xylographa opegraphella]|nr:Cytochrome c oxidase assembly protein cox15 [Xylographa opegraphella]